MDMSEADNEFPVSGKKLLKAGFLLTTAFIVFFAFYTLSSPKSNAHNAPLFPPSNSEQPSGPGSAVNVNPGNTAITMQPSSFSVKGKSLKGTIYFYDSKGKKYAVNGTLKVSISSEGKEVFSRQLSLRASDFNSRVQTITKTSFENGHQEIKEEKLVDYFYELEIPLAEINKTISQKGTVSLNFYSLSGAQLSWQNPVSGLPRDPEKYTGNPDSLSGPAVVVYDKSGQIPATRFMTSGITGTIYYRVFFSLTEKGIRVSSPGTLEISAENKAGEKIYSKTLEVKPGDFSFEAIKSSWLHKPSESLKYIFELSSKDIPAGECISKISVSFTVPSGKVLEGETTSRTYCVSNCELKKLCPKEPNS